MHCWESLEQMLICSNDNIKAYYVKLHASSYDFAQIQFIVVCNLQGGLFSSGIYILPAYHSMQCVNVVHMYV